MNNFARVVRLSCVSLLALSLADCESTGDPRQGGIFWSEAKARDRLAAQRAEVQQAQSEAAEERATTLRLRARHETLSATIARQHQESRELGAEIASLQGGLGGAESNGKIDAELSALNQKRVALMRDDSRGAADKEAELARLRAEVNRLKERNQLLRQTR